jgi:hypothetical protein
VEHRAAAVRAIVETGRRAAGIGATVLGVWPGADLPAGGPDDWARTAESLAAVADSTRSLGLTVAVEPKPGQLVAGTQDAIRLCEEIGDPGIGVLLDTAHALAAGEDIEALPERIGTRLMSTSGTATAATPTPTFPRARFTTSARFSPHSKTRVTKERCPSTSTARSAPAAAREERPAGWAWPTSPLPWPGAARDCG